MPLGTSGYVYVPCSFTMVEHVLARAPELLEGRRVVELGAGLGLIATVLQQWAPPPARLLATDGDQRVVPLLAANLDANAPAATPARVAERCELLWGGAALAAAGLGAQWDVVLASDA
eukprot:3687214-Prymnesium_polylepis.1